MTKETKMYDVVAVNMDTNKVRFMEQNKTLPNAEAIVNMAVMRRGVDEEFYAPVIAGSHKEGDEYDHSKSA